MPVPLGCCESYVRIMTDASSPLPPARQANAVPPVLLEQYGYVEEERIVSGTARSYVVEEQTEDGFWAVAEGDAAEYRTRICVRRPADPSAWNGVVAVEWFNVSAGVDGDPDFGVLYPVVMGEGYAYVAVSAQRISIDGGGTSIMELPEEAAAARRPLVERDPERYGSLVHPGDEFSYDIYAQVGALLRTGSLTGGEPTHVIAVGESQSAFRLVSYINAVHSLTGAYDGFLVHSRGAGAAPVSGEQAMDDPRARPPVHLRTDLDVPVLQ